MTTVAPRSYLFASFGALLGSACFILLVHNIALSRSRLLWLGFDTVKDSFWTQSTSRSPDFRHRFTKEGLWIDGVYNPSWVHEELKRISMVDSQYVELGLQVLNKNGNEISNEQHKEEFCFVDSLKICAKRKDLRRGTMLHNDILERGLLGSSPYVASALINMYAKCGDLAKAQQVVYELPVKATASWNALISGYMQHGQACEAIKCFESMKKEGMCPNVVTYTCILKACGTISALDKGQAIHDEIIKEGYFGKDVVLGNALVDMYVKCGMLSRAHEVLHQLPVRDVVSWNTIIAGYVHHEQNSEALACFESMQTEGLCPDTVTYTCILKACSSIEDIQMGIKIHYAISARDLLVKSIALGNALMDMYAKCGILTKAEQVFNDLSERDVVSWSALIAGYTNQGRNQEALNCFEQMQTEGLSPDAITFICILKACSNLKFIVKGKEIHAEIVARGLLEQNIKLGNVLVDMYAKCGLLQQAQKVLQELPVRNVVSWSALIAGYVQQGQGQEALKCFEQMEKEGHSPNVVTLTNILKACANTVSMEKGKQIHDEIVTKELLENNVLLGTALVDMYSKHGMLIKAQEVLQMLPIRNVISWSALIAGFSQQGQGNKALNCFKEMQREGISPDAVTILCVLDACRHSGLLDDAQKHFDNMKSEHGVTPTIEHFTCMVDALGCAGHFDKAISLIENTQSSDYHCVWLAVLSACRKWGNIKLAKLAFDKAIQLDHGNAVQYTLMAEIYADAGMEEDSKKVQTMSTRIKLTEKLQI